MDDHRVHPQLGVRSEPDGMSESSSIASIQMCDLAFYFIPLIDFLFLNIWIPDEEQCFRYSWDNINLVLDICSVQSLSHV